MTPRSLHSIGRRIVALALLGGVATCDRERTLIAPNPPSPTALAGSGASTITHTLLAAGNNKTNQAVYTTAVVAPAPNTLVTIAVLGHRETSGALASPTIAGGGMTAWTAAATIDFDTVATRTHKRLTVYRAMSGAPGSGPITITWSANVSNCQWIVSQWDGVVTTGVNGADAIGQTGTNRADLVNGLTVGLGGFGSSGNVGYGVFAVRSSTPAITPGAGLAEIAEQSSGETQQASLMTEWGLNANTINATWTNLNGGALGFEIKGSGSSGGTPVPVSTVAVSPPTATVPVGATVQLTATPKDVNGTPLTGRVVTWTSDGAAATVDGSGLVTGASVGSATISATSEGQVGTAAVTVTVPVASVDVSPPVTSLEAGATVQLTATPKDESGTPLVDRVVTWGTDNPIIASVNSSGLVTAVSIGTATISAMSEGKSGTAIVTVSGVPPGTPVTLVGAGDIASCSSTGDEATATLLDQIPGTVFTAGDNAYDKGSPTDFAQCYAPSWGRHKARTFPAPGNHDYGTPGASGYYEYFGTQAGPPGTGYYSYDLGEWHVISLNSNVAMSVGSAQEQWLRADLAASTKQCTLAYWHHPRFSSGSHHGSTVATQPLWQALYEAGAEIVISGHEHNYERFGSQTPTGTADPGTGIREFVVGTGGDSHYNDQLTPLPNSELFNGTTWGVLKLTLSPGTYTWEFIPIAGEAFTDAGSGTCHGPGVSTSRSGMTVAPASVTASGGASAATITVTARDFGGNPVSGATVAITASGTGNAITQPGGPTDVNGEAKGALSSTVAETKTVTATINTLPIAASALVAVTADAPAMLAFTGQPSNVPRGGTITPPVAVAVRDRFGNQVTNATNSVTVAIGTNPASGTLTGTTTASANAGVATFGDLQIDQAGIDYTLRATSDLLSDATSATFNVTSGAASASRSSVSASPTSLTAGSGSATVIVTVRDVDGVPVKGAWVTLSATGSATVNQPTEPTDVDGVATGTLSSTVAGETTVTANADGVTLNDRPIVTTVAAALSPSVSTITAVPTSIVAGSGTSTISVAAKDDFGNPVIGASVVLAASGAGNTLAQPTGPTDAGGVATGTLASSTVETKVVSATVGGVQLTQQVLLAVVAPGVAGIGHSRLTSGNSAVNQAVYTTASIAPAPNSLVTIAVLGHRQTSGALASPMVAGGGMSAWTAVATIDLDTVATTTHKRLTLYRAMSGAPGSGPITITWSANVSNCQWIVSQWTGVDAAGTNGSGALVQTVSNRGDQVSGLSAALAPLASPLNVAYGLVATNAGGLGINPGAGFTEIDERYSGELPHAVLEAEWAIFANPVAASWSSPLNGAVLAVEIKAATAP